MPLCSFGEHTCLNVGSSHHVSTILVTSVHQRRIYCSLNTTLVSTTSAWLPGIITMWLWTENIQGNKNVIFIRKRLFSHHIYFSLCILFVVWKIDNCMCCDEILTKWPWEIQIKLKIRNFQGNLSNCWLWYLLWNCPLPKGDCHRSAPN